MLLAWRAEWVALSRRISGILGAGEFYLRSLSPEERNPPEIAKELLRNSQEIFRGLEIFLQAYERVLPVQAAAALRGFVERARPHFNADAEHITSTTGTKISVQLRLVELATLEAELSYKLTEFETTARRLSERAFSHLQRCIVADAEVAERWQRAYADGELACEKLGAAHLLSHGIWAFKAASTGERTDLIFHDRVDLAEAERSAEALVLTEWKLVRHSDNPATKAREAYDEAKLYSEGSLAGFQLEKQRFLVLVSQGRCSLPPDFEEEGVRYRHVNISVEPEPPSRAARRGLKKRTTPRSTGRIPR